MQYWGNPVAKANMEFVRCRPNITFNFTGT